MRDVTCKLLTTSYITDSIGVEKEIQTEKEVPIIAVEDVRENEYYDANQLGYKPNLRLRISNFSYENEPELIYMNTTYTIIRTQEITADEIVVICERKVKNADS